MSVAGAICCLLPGLGLEPDVPLSNEGLFANALVTIVATTILIAIANAMYPAVIAPIVAKPPIAIAMVTPIANTGDANVNNDKNTSILLNIIESNFHLIL